MESTQWALTTHKIFVSSEYSSVGFQAFQCTNRCLLFCLFLSLSTILLLFFFAQSNGGPPSNENETTRQGEIKGASMILRFG